MFHATLDSLFCFRDSEDTILLILKEIYAMKGIQPLKVGVESPTRVPLGPPPSMMSPSPSRHFTASFTDFATNMARNSHSQTGVGSSSATNLRNVPAPTAPTPFQQYNVSSHTFTPPPPPPPGAVSSGAATPRPAYASATHSSSSLHAVPVQLTSPAPMDASATPGPPPLSGFVRKN